MLACLNVEDVETCLTQNNYEWVGFLVEVCNGECKCLEGICGYWVGNIDYCLPVVNKEHACWIAAHKKFVFFIFYQIHRYLIQEYDCLRVLFVKLETVFVLILLKSGYHERLTFKSFVS